MVQDTRRSKSLCVLKTDLNYEGYPVAGYVQYETETGIKERLETWAADGLYKRNDTNEHDLMCEWVDPDYRYTPVFKNGPYEKPFDNMGDAIEYAGLKSELDNPLIGYLRIDLGVSGGSFAKPGEEFK